MKKQSTFRQILNELKTNKAATKAIVTTLLINTFKWLGIPSFIIACYSAYMGYTSTTIATATLVAISIIMLPLSKKYKPLQKVALDNLIKLANDNKGKSLTVVPQGENLLIYVDNQLATAINDSSASEILDIAKKQGKKLIKKLPNPSTGLVRPTTGYSIPLK